MAVVVATPVRYPPVVCTMPFGLAVEPDEYSRNSGCSASIGSAGQWGSAPDSRSWYHTSRPGRMGHGEPAERTTTMVCSVARSLTASSTAALTGAVLPLRRAPSAVISAFAADTSSRSRTADGENPPKTTLCGAPILAQASIATTTSGIIGR